MRYDFSKKVDELLITQRRTKKSLYDKLGMTGNGFDAMMKNNSFSAVRLAEIADFFGIQVAELYGEIVPIPDKSSSSNEGGYLQDHLTALEQKFNKLLDQLTVKDQQIAGLQRTVDTLVGKSEGATDNPLSFDEFSMEMMYHHYTQSVRRNLIAPVVQTLRLSTRP